MKKYLNILTILFFIIAFPVSAQEKWQEWQPTSCYENIEFRLRFVRQHGDKTVSEVQFKNNYNQLVTFNYGFTEDEEDFLTEYRKTLHPKEAGKPEFIYTKGDNFYILVDKLSFSVSGENPLPCEQKK
ncbi:MAG TPA: hypothetical protein VK010_04390 [Flavobacteriaceae bacterium]|nr:hypothetical protein [Flavobacteriaceae bacterium]